MPHLIMSRFILFGTFYFISSHPCTCTHKRDKYSHKQPHTGHHNLQNSKTMLGAMCIGIERAGIQTLPPTTQPECGRMGKAILFNIYISEQMFFDKMEHQLQYVCNASPFGSKRPRRIFNRHYHMSSSAYMVRNMYSFKFTEMHLQPTCCYYPEKHFF